MLSKGLTASVLQLVPGFLTLGVMILWAADDGGYDRDTWYWGALFVLALLMWRLAAYGRLGLALTRASKVGLLAFGLFVAWSYLSIAWAGTPADALDGSNRALLYFLIFALFLITPWTARSASIALSAFAFGVGAIAVVLITRLASGDHVSVMFSEGRLLVPTGYINSSAALFTTGALVAIVLAARRDLPSPVRGALLALACAELQLALLAQSRGWLFTLPLVALATLGLVRGRALVAGAALLPAIGTLAVLSRLLGVFRSERGSMPTTALDHAATHAGRGCLLICAAVLVGGGLMAAGEKRLHLSLTPTVRRALTTLATALALGAIGARGIVATGGHPVGFVSSQWRGFTHPDQRSTPSSHFAVRGTERPDIWRVALDAVRAHPIGGLGQDNFADYYVTRRHTKVEPKWTHSLELRLLAHIGLVGFALFLTFLFAAIRSTRPQLARTGATDRALAGACLVPLAVWLIHGSIDWFWEMPALSGPALAFLAIAGALARAAPAPASGPASRQRASRLPRFVRIGVVVVALLGILIALVFPYLAVREISLAAAVSARDPTAALGDLALAARLNPLDPQPGRFAGQIALDTGEWRLAEQRYRQAIAREPGGWLAWLGDGLAASELGDRPRARRDFAIAASINSQQPAVTVARARIDTRHPLTPQQAFRMIAVAV